MILAPSILSADFARLAEEVARAERGGAELVHVEVDGGVDASNIRSLVEAGAEVLVAGSGVFGQGDAEAAVRRLVEVCR